MMSVLFTALSVHCHKAGSSKLSVFVNEDLPSLDPSTLSLPNKALPVFTLTITPSLPFTNILNSFAYHQICWKILLLDAFHCPTLSEVPHHDVR